SENPATELAGNEADTSVDAIDDLPGEQREPSLGDLDNLDVDTRPRRKVTFRPESGYEPLAPAETSSDAQESVSAVTESDVDAGPPEADPDEADTADFSPAHAEDSGQRSDDEPRPPPDEVMIINVMARGDTRFSGADL